MKKLKGQGMIAVTLMYIFLPVIALAQFGEVNTFIGKISEFINGVIIPFIFGLALLMFIWGVFKYFILGGSDEGKQEEGKQLILYSVIGLVVMVSIFGIVNLVANGFFGETDRQNIQNIPNIPTNNT